VLQLFFVIEFKERIVMYEEPIDDEQIIEHIRANPPSCLKEFNLLPGELPESWDDKFKTIYQLECQCGNKTGKILGYPLRDYNPDYKGDEFITPIAFQCDQCTTVTEIIDTAVHGYHSEIAKIEGGIGATKFRGSGLRSAFACPECSEIAFQTTVGFIYWNFDLIYDEPELPAQEFFNVFLMYGHCQNCGKTSQVTDLGKL
jgi:hypothetical protein